MKKLFLHSFKSSLGTIRTAATDKGLAVVALPNENNASFNHSLKKTFPDYEIVLGGPVNQQAENEIKAYLDGHLKKFKVKLDLHATPFQKKVLSEVARIPYGEKRTYGEVAARLGNARASRAVGTANANNPLPLVIPCHRVVATTGLGGYGGGLKMKKSLLDMENKA